MRLHTAIYKELKKAIPKVHCISVQVIVNNEEEQLHIITWTKEINMLASVDIVNIKHLNYKGIVKRVLEEMVQDYKERNETTKSVA